MCELTREKVQRLYDYYKSQKTDLFKDFKSGYLKALSDIMELMSQ